MLVERQTEAKARGVYPAIAHIVKSPYRIIGCQRICDFVQSIRVGDSGKAVVFFFEGYASSLGFSLYPFVAIEDDLSSKRRMAAHLYGDMSPLRIHDVKEVMIDKLQGLSQIKAALAEAFERSTQS